MSEAPTTGAGPGGSYVCDQPWRNWAGNIQTTPAYTVAAATEEEVVAAVRFAIADDLTVRVVGSGHSWTGLGETSGVQINVGNIRHFRVSDRARKRVVMGAGISIFEACEALWEEGFSLKNQGDIDVQTITGAASTGTHGSGITLRNIASSICRIRLVNGRGELVEITEDQQDVMNAARVALGTMGVITEIELEVIDRYFLEEEVTYPSWEEVVRDWDDNVAHNLHASLFWFPQQNSPALYDIDVPDRPMADRAQLRRINKTDGPARPIDESRRIDRTT